MQTASMVFVIVDSGDDNSEPGFNDESCILYAFSSFSA